LNIVNLLCNHGADKNIPTNKGEVAAQLTSEGVIKVLLNAMKGAGTPSPKSLKKEPLAITPNYLRNPVLNYEVDIGERERLREEREQLKYERELSAAHKEKLGEKDHLRFERELAHREKRLKFNNHDQVHERLDTELILKIRTAGSLETDYIEIEMPRDALTLEYLIVVGCEELELNPSAVERVRKMPNTRLRRDKEVERLKDYQEIEFVLRQEPQQSEENAVACNGVVNDQTQEVARQQEAQKETDSIDTIETSNTETETNAETEPEDMEQNS